MGPRKWPRPKDYPALTLIKDKIYHVIFAKKLKDKRGLLDGLCDLELKLIMISLDQTPRNMYSTYLHEKMHAIEHEYKLPLGHPRIERLESLFVETINEFPDFSGLKKKR